MSIEHSNVNVCDSTITPAVTHSYLYRVCSVCSVSWVLLSVDNNTRSNITDLLVICNKCKDVHNVSSTSNVQSEARSNLVTSTHLSNNKIIAERNSDTCLTVSTQHSSQDLLNVNSKPLPLFKYQNDERLSALSKSLSNLNDSLCLSDSPLCSNNSRKNCLLKTDDELVAARNTGSSPLSVRMDPVDQLKEDSKVSMSRILELPVVTSSKAILQLSTSSNSYGLIEESDISIDLNVKIDAQDESSTINTTWSASHLKEINTDSKEGRNVSLDINGTLSQQVNVLHNEDNEDDDDMVNPMFVKAEIEPSQIPHTFDCSVTNPTGRDYKIIYNPDISDTTKSLTNRADIIDAHKDVGNRISNLTQERDEVEYSDKNDLLKGSILHVILCPIDISSTNRKPCCHQCRVCLKIFLYTAHLRRHERTHSDILENNECSQLVPAIEAQSCSDGKVSDGVKSLSCTQCHKMFNTSTRLETHVRQVHGRVNKKKKCHKSNDMMVNTHDGKQPYVCKQCNTRFTYGHTLKRHIRTIHDKLFLHVCTECGKGCRDNSKLRRHMINQHKSKDPIKIKNKSQARIRPIQRKRQALASDLETICVSSDVVRHSHAMNEPIALSQQSVNISSTETPQVVGVEQSIQCPTVLVSHAIEEPVGVHVTESSSDGEVSKQVNARGVMLSRGVNAESWSDGEVSDGLKSVSCTHCHKKFNSTKRLTRHLRQVHCSEKKKKCLKSKYTAVKECRSKSSPHYGEKCNQNEEWIVHQKPYDGKQPFVCEQCKTRFACRNSLTRHIRTIHDKLFLYACKECGKGCRDKLCLIRHMISIHKSKDPIKTSGKSKVRVDHI